MSTTSESITATGAKPLPSSGLRPASPRDLLRRNEALSCLRDSNPTQCQGKIHINIFFDGTGNNEKWAGTFDSVHTRSTQTQLARNGHSNVSRLYHAAIEEPEVGLFNYYSPGVGTPFDEVDDTNPEGSTFGAAFAKFGARRINWAILQVYNAVSTYVQGSDIFPDNDATKAQIADMSSVMASRVFKNWIEDPSRPLPEDQHRQMRLREKEQRLRQVLEANELRKKVLEINVSVFGFSRGAAQARAFVHWLYEIARYNNWDCARQLAGKPLRVKFMGIFDTVASVGVTSMSRIVEGKMDWAEGEMMSIPHDVEQCVHFAALHEQRINFPVDLIAPSGETRKQVLYPGMHSDVGGGYGPGSQGKAMPAWGASPCLSQVPLIDMYHEAFKAGLFILSPDEIKNDPTLNSEFSCDTRLVDAYNRWLQEHGIPGGDHRQQIRGHTRQYVRWRARRRGDGAENLRERRFYKEANGEDRRDLRQAYIWEGANLLERRVDVRDIFFGDRELLSAYEESENLPDAAAMLFDDYVHDSLAGFYMWRFTELTMPVLRTYGYGRYRDNFRVLSTEAASVCRPYYPPNNVDIGRVFQQMSM